MEVQEIKSAEIHAEPKPQPVTVNVSAIPNVEVLQKVKIVPSVARDLNGVEITLPKDYEYTVINVYPTSVQVIGREGAKYKVNKTALIV